MDSMIYSRGFIVIVTVRL